MPAKLRSPNIQSRVIQDVRDRIHSGQFNPGDRLPSYSEMVAEYGVSLVTVDRVYNSLQQEGLIVRQQGRGTFVAEPKVATAKSAIALCIPPPKTQNPGTAYWMQLREGIGEVLQREGLSLTVIDDLSPGIAEQADGMLHASYQSMDKVRSLLPSDFSMVSLIVPREGMTSVLSDDTAGVRQAAEHLLGLGHRRIAYLTQGSNLSPEQSPDVALEKWRLNSYQNTLTAAGIEPAESWVRRGSGKAVNNYFLWGRAMMMQWLQEDWGSLGCTALMAQNDEMAVGAMQVLQDEGVKVPGQVSVVGFDSTAWCDFVSPALTSVEIPLHAMGAKATELLLQKIRAPRTDAGSTETETIFMPTQLVVRKSTCPPG